MPHAQLGVAPQPTVNAELHRRAYARRGCSTAPPSFRTMDELDVVTELVVDAYTFVTGRSLETGSLEAHGT
jgi:hypothetical protein